MRAVTTTLPIVIISTICLLGGARGNHADSPIVVPPALVGNSPLGCLGCHGGQYGELGPPCKAADPARTGLTGRLAFASPPLWQPAAVGGIIGTDLVSKGWRTSVRIF